MSDGKDARATLERQIVVAFRMPPAGLTPGPEGPYLARARSMCARGEALGGRLVAWSGAILAMAWETDAIEEALELATSLREESSAPERAWTCGVAEGELEPLAQDGQRMHLAWGDALRSAASLARVAKAGEVLVDGDVRALRSGQLALIGARSATDAGQRVRGWRLDLDHPWKQGPPGFEPTRIAPAPEVRHASPGLDVSQASPGIDQTSPGIDVSKTSPGIDVPDLEASQTSAGSDASHAAPDPASHASPGIDASPARPHPASPVFRSFKTTQVPPDFAASRAEPPDFAASEAETSDFFPSKAVPADFVPGEAEPPDFAASEAEPAGFAGDVEALLAASEERDETIMVTADDLEVVRPDRDPTQPMAAMAFEDDEEEELSSADVLQVIEASTLQPFEEEPSTSARRREGTLADRVRALSQHPSNRDPVVAIADLRRARIRADGAAPGVRCQAALALALTLSIAGRVEEALLETLDALSSARVAQDPRAVNACIALLAKLYTGAGFPDAARTLKETAERTVTA